MNAPVHVYFDEAVDRQIKALREDNARLRNAEAKLSKLEEGELGAYEHEALMRSCRMGAEMMIHTALMLEGMFYNAERRKSPDAAPLKRVAQLLRMEAGRARDVGHKLYEQGNCFIHPEG